MWPALGVVPLSLHFNPDLSQPLRLAEFDVSDWELKSRDKIELFLMDLQTWKSPLLASPKKQLTDFPLYMPCNDLFEIDGAEPGLRV